MAKIDLNQLLEPTYKIETPPEPAMSWDKYQELIGSEWEELLNHDPSPSEKEIQNFLEKNPSLVPGSRNLTIIRSGHAPLANALISQPILPSFRHRIPDFMWLSTNSEIVEPVLIEIEAPRKKWFTKSGQPTSDLTQALNQINEWKAWFDETHNIEAFKAFYGLNDGRFEGRHFKPSYLLIYGRREEANQYPDFAKKRSHLTPHDVFTMTYDRLTPDRNGDQLICIKVQNNHGKSIFKTISVPPTFQLGPQFAEERSKMSEMENAVNMNQHISQVRKEFLVRRIPYWINWSKQSNRGGCRSGDFE